MLLPDHLDVFRAHIRRDDSVLELGAGAGRLTKELEAQHFRGLFDKRGQQQRLKKLKKLRKQLATLEGTAAVSTPVRREEPAAPPRPVKKPAVKPATKTVLPMYRGNFSGPKAFTYFSSVGCVDSRLVGNLRC